MKSKLFLLFLLAVGFSCSPFRSGELVPLPRAAGPNTLDSMQARTVFTAMQHLPNGTQFSLCILIGDSERYTGVLRKNDSLFYIENRDSVFEIGSITKTFTGTMLAKLVREGIVRPDDPVQKFLPVRMKQSSLNGKEMTLVQLAEHTSGLPFEPTNVKDDPLHQFDPYSPNRYYTTDRLYDYLTHFLALQSTPGEKRTYSNLGGGLLGHILTLIAKKPYEDLLFETVCAPLGMKNTFITLNNERARHMVHGRDVRGSVIPFSGDDGGPLTGAGGIKSSARDLAKYLRTNMTDTTYFYLAQKPTKWFNEHFAGGLGWAPYSESGMVHQGAFGATGGYTCGVIFERNTRVGIVLLTNVSAFQALQGNHIEGLCRELYDPLPLVAKRK